MLVDHRGRPMAPAQSAARAMAPLRKGGYAGLPGSPLGGSSAFPYRAAAWQTPEMGDWNPSIRSPDSEINQYRDRMVARQRDLVRNDGWSAGAVIRILDNVIGSGLKLSASPNHQALALVAGAGFDAVWGNEFRQAAEAKWKDYSNSLGRWNDLARKLTVGQQHRVCFYHKLVDAECLTLPFWREDRVGPGRADYATTFSMVDPDRLSNPNQAMDTDILRGGVEIDPDDGVVVAYHIRKAEPNDYYNAADSMIWERVEREDPDGWPRVFHDFAQQRASQNRGVSVIAPILGHAKMLARYYGLELQQAAVGAQFGTYLKSPYDPDAMADAVVGAPNETEIGAYQQLRLDWANERPAMLDGVSIPTLAPGEDITSVSSSHPHDGFADFTAEMLRMQAAAWGMSAEQYSNAWFRTNYSSARAALLESWKTVLSRRDEFVLNTATPMYACWLWEAVDNGELPLPRNAPAFREMATAYSRCTWRGPARGWVDPVKEPQGAVLRMDGGLSTLRDECAEQGQDWEEVIDQRAIELARFKDKGVPPPSWAQMNVGADQAAQPEQEPQAQ